MSRFCPIFRSSTTTFALAIAAVLGASSRVHAQVIFSSSSTINGEAIDMPVMPMISSVLGGDGFRGAQKLPTDMSQLLRMKQIKNELGLDDEQSNTINDLSKAMRQQVSEVMKHIEFGNSDSGKIIQEAQRKIRGKAEEKLEEVLTPQQLSRLKEIKTQVSLRARGPLALLSGELGDEIRLTDKQQKELKAVHAKKKVELEEEIKRLRERYLEETIEAVLDDKQQKKFKDMVGKVYKVKTPDFGSMISSSLPAFLAPASEDSDRE